MSKAIRYKTGLGKRVKSVKQSERCTRHLTTTTRILLLGRFPTQSRTRRYASLVASMHSVLLGTTNLVNLIHKEDEGDALLLN